MYTLSEKTALSSHKFLLTNGLGGYASINCDYRADRCDQGVLIAAVRCPNERITAIHELRETLETGGQAVALEGNGRFFYQYVPKWEYQVGNVTVHRQLALEYGKNTAALLYTVENRGNSPCVFTAQPLLKPAPKQEALQKKAPVAWKSGKFLLDGTSVYVKTEMDWTREPAQWQWLSYPDDAKDGRPEKGLCVSLGHYSKTVAPGEITRFSLVFSTDPEPTDGEAVIVNTEKRLAELEANAPFRHPIARQLTVSADAYIAHRDSTNGKTILAGFPLFSDWGRDTMISLPGCMLATGRYEDAKNSLKTFLAYEKDGLVPNLFPEGHLEPMYNTVDAALLLVDAIWKYYERTGDEAFVKEAWPVLERIVAAYRRGTHHNIHMDTDGLVVAGQGLDQVTWMDARIGDFVPTPRHGKPVEVNAYWYNALCIMDAFAEKFSLDAKDYGQLAQQVKKSFVDKFYMPDKGWLKDLISGTAADEQFRCNQIWAVAMPFTMLTHSQERQVVENVRKYLLTDCGLRTLSPEDAQYQGYYGGEQLLRDKAYHQGTVWVFPMGAYYLSCLKIGGDTADAARDVLAQLEKLKPMLEEGCLGQLPEIYDGDDPYEGKGCFAQAWSVGEMLRVFEAVEKILKTDNAHKTGRNQ